MKAAFHLAWADDSGFGLTRFGYLSPDAAVRAAPTVNRARACKGLAPVTYLAAFDETEHVAIRPLSEIEPTVREDLS